MSHESILVVDDEEVMRDVLGSLLTQAGYEVSLAPNGPDGLELVRKGSYSAAIVDMMLPEMDGMTVLEELKRIDPRAGDPDDHRLRVGRDGDRRDAERRLRLRGEALQARRAAPHPRQRSQPAPASGREPRAALGASGPGTVHGDRGQEPADAPGLSASSRRAAPSRSTILVAGESGTGKELVAKAIHTNSPRKDKPFVVVNSGSLPHDLLESNLFGHVKGAFTGAVYAKKGLFELADTGTLFFDEIGNVPLETQSKLLRVMQEREFMRLGGVETIKVDVRVVAATNVDLRRAVDEGTFREDLFYRLNVIAVPLPPLRQRKEDIPALVQHFTEKYAEENAKVVEGVTPDVLQTLLDYDWPGNVRELENVIERGVVLTTSPVIDKDLVPEHVRSSPSFQMPQVAVPPEGINLREVIARFERRLIESTLEATGGVQKDAAQLLRLKPTTLNEMIKRHSILLPRDRERRNAGRADASPAKTTSA